MKPDESLEAIIRRLERLSQELKDLSLEIDRLGKGLPQAGGSESGRSKKRRRVKNDQEE